MVSSHEDQPKSVVAFVQSQAQAYVWAGREKAQAYAGPVQKCWPGENLTSIESVKQR
jgi:hypothetical protein